MGKPPSELNGRAPYLLGERIRLERVRKRLQQKDVARRAGISAGQLSRIEQGKVKSPGLQTLSAIATAMDISLSMLIEPEGKMISN
jgi:transcriptional regulator with XRE-family HTH domain